MNKSMVKLVAIFALLACPVALAAADKQEPKKCKMSATDGTTYVDLVRQDREVGPALRDAKARVQALEQAQAQIQKNAEEVVKPYLDGMKLDVARDPWGFIVDRGEVFLVELPRAETAPAVSQVAATPEAPPKK